MKLAQLVTLNADQADSLSVNFTRFANFQSFKPFFVIDTVITLHFTVNRITFTLLLFELLIGLCTGCINCII